MSYYRLNHRSKRGFTLIELLVVITIISILAAVIFPVFAQVREKARQTACLSNEKQIGLAVMQYAQDYDEIIVPSYVGGQGPASQNVWCGLLQPYIKNGLNNSTPGNIQNADAQGVYKCPSFNSGLIAQAMEMPDCDGPGSSVGVMPPMISYADYGIAQYYGPSGSGASDDPYNNFPGSGPPPQAPNTFFNLSLAAVLRPAETANISDAWTGVPADGSRFGTLFGCEGSLIHQGGSNYVFLDGHAKYLKGNLMHYKSQDGNGLYYMTYLTYDR